MGATLKSLNTGLNHRFTGVYTEEALDSSNVFVVTGSTHRVNVQKKEEEENGNKNMKTFWSIYKQ